MSNDIKSFEEALIFLCSTRKSLKLSLKERIKKTCKQDAAFLTVVDVVEIVAACGSFPLCKSLQKHNSNLRLLD